MLPHLLRLSRLRCLLPADAMTGLFAAWLRFCGCLKVALICAAGRDWRTLASVRYGDIVRDVHTPIMMIGLVALLGAWRDPVHMAIAIAGIFGMVCLFLMQRLLDNPSSLRSMLERRRALAAWPRIDEAIPLMPLRWRSALARSGGAPPPPFSFSYLFDTRNATVWESYAITVAFRISRFIH